MRKIILAFVLICQTCYFANSQIVINEIFASNVSAFFEKGTFNFTGYVELYNKGSVAINIGNYYISNIKGTENLFMIPQGATIQPQGFYVIYCDGTNNKNHANFKLDADGETIFLYNNTLTLIDSIHYGRQYPDIAYGQKPDGTGKWTRLGTPTPQKSNNSAKSSSVVCSRPVITPVAGFFDASVKVTILRNPENGEIRYTTDGSEPTINSKLYTAPFYITGSSVVKAKTFHNTFLCSGTSCHSYFIKEHKSNLPVVSISTDSRYLYDDSIGIYVIGKNGITGNCTGKANFNRDWERPGFFEYFTEDGKLRVSQGLDLKVSGGCSRSNPNQKSFGLLPSSRYGSGKLDYAFFKSRPHIKGYGSLMLRNAGNDWSKTMFRDAVEQEIVFTEMDVDYQAYQPVAVYLNGKYFGLMNLREKVDKNYLRGNYGLPSDRINILEKNNQVISGSKSSYISFIDSLNKVDISTDEGYRLLDRNIDLEEYLNYLVVQIYFANKDWPGNNIKYWQKKEAGSKWRWILTDLDFGLGANAKWNDSTLYFVTKPNGTAWPNPAWSTLLPRKIFENPITRTLFIQKMLTAINTVFSNERVNFKIDSIKDYIAHEMNFHWKRFGGSSTTWSRNIDVMRNFNNSRGDFMKWHLKEFFNLTDTCREIIFNNPKNGKVSYFLNRIEVKDTFPEEFFENIPVTIEARPLPGYEFERWDCKIFHIRRNDLIPLGSLWRYSDKNPYNMDISWKNPEFNDTGWNMGAAELGYGDNDEKTVIGYGPETANKYITTFYRKNFTVTDLSELYELEGKLLYDDGAIVYLNGHEVLRVNMPYGPVGYSTLAASGKEDDNYFKTFSIPSKFVTQGENVIAVEIHQNTSNSNDISFDLSLTAKNKEFKRIDSFPDPVINGFYPLSMELTAILKPSIPVSGLVINEVSVPGNFSRDDKEEEESWLEIYNNGNQNIALNKIKIEYTGNDTIVWPLASFDTSIIKPGQFVIYWTDQEISEGQNHLPFKLEGIGETIRIIQMTGDYQNILDTFKVDKFYFESTVGRYPDGNNRIYFMALPTPGTKNKLAEIDPTEITDSFIQLFPNPAKDHIYLRLMNFQNSNIHATIFDINGRNCFSFSMDNTLEKVNLTTLKPGIYALRIIIGHHTFYKKLMIMK